MNREEILKARKNYEKMQKEKKELIALKKELLELEKDTNVKRYLEICSINKSEVYSEKDIIRLSFSGVSKTESDFKIYLYIGAFCYARNFDEHDEMVFNKKEADYLSYLNIENQSDCVNIHPSMQEQFEKDNIVLKCKHTLRADSKYYELQEVLYEQFLKGDLRNKAKILEKVKEHL